MRDKGRFNKDLTVVYQQPLSSTNVVVPVELIARREEPESSMAVLECGRGETLVRTRTVRRTTNKTY